MDENAGLHVACGVDVEVIPAAGNAAADIFAVVLEVHDEKGLAAFAVSGFSQPFIHMLALLRGRNKFNGSVVADRHEAEV